jgi:hypothetical protein
MLRRRRLVLLFGLHEAAAVEDAEGLLDGAFGQAGFLRDVAVAQANARDSRRAAEPARATP